MAINENNEGNILLHFSEISAHDPFGWHVDTLLPFVRSLHEYSLAQLYVLLSPSRVPAPVGPSAFAISEGSSAQIPKIIQRKSCLRSERALSGQGPSPQICFNFAIQRYMGLMILIL